MKFYKRERKGENSKENSKGYLEGIATSLDLKFGAEGLELMPEIKPLNNLETLEAILTAIKQVKTIDELRQIYRH